MSAHGLTARLDHFRLKSGELWVFGKVKVGVLHVHPI